MTFLGLVAIWLPEFPAMQDYPQHLFMANVISNLENSKLNWSSIFVSDLKFGPYMFFYFFVSSLSSLMSIHAAGKAFLSFALILVTLLVLAWNKPRDKKSSPWALLVIFPLFFPKSILYYYPATFALSARMLRLR
ncbi:MAG: hypothetical protein QME81_20755, partial [bacterium]|nr:hypothetical protein [bacterium]